MLTLLRLRNASDLSLFSVDAILHVIKPFVNTSYNPVSGALRGFVFSFLPGPV
ncbi:hypothetical protein HRG84_05830 [Flavisolibacter sp. BT320]|nr:hypothetical protein [Flavisolibacter longurius]